MSSCGNYDDLQLTLEVMECLKLFMLDFPELHQRA